MTERCKENVGRSYSYVACGKPGKFERKAEELAPWQKPGWYCGVHDPVSRAARREAKNAAKLAAMIPCELCATPTPMLGTKRCDRCYELETRIKRDPELAERILRSVAEQRKVGP